GSPTGGSIDSSSAGKRHYGHYTSATCGTFTVTATSHPGNVSTAASVTVTGCPLPVASVSVTPATATIGVGQTAQYAAITRDAFGNPLGGRTVTWASSNPAVATVNGAGQATGVAVGSATLTATSEGKSGTAAILVTNVPVASVTVSPATASVPAGQTVQLTATLKDANGNTLTGRTVTWSSDNTALVAAGRTRRSSAEDLTSVGYTGGDVGHYARKHYVFALLSDVANDPAQTNRLVPFTQFATDLANGTLPTFSNIVPNLCNDAHDCGL